jgi:AraC-like DNA-binding protein
MSDRPPVVPSPARSPEQLSYATSDPAEAHAFMRSAYVDNSMRITGSQDGFRMRHTFHDAGRFSVASLAHTMSVEHSAQPLGYLLLGRVLHGGAERRTGGDVLQAGQGDLFLIAQPELPYTIRWDSMELQLTRIDQDALTQLVGDTTPDAVGRPLFTGLEAVSPAAARHCAKVLDFLTGDILPDPDALASPLIVGSAARMLAAALLSTFPNTTHADPATGDRDASSPATLRRAVEFVEANAHRDIGLGDIAMAAHVTPRAVQLAFRQHLDTTPMAYLRRVRLAHAHSDLLAADPGRGDTVTSIATTWGFHHQGRFAASYRAAYGHSPGSTLRS